MLSRHPPTGQLVSLGLFPTSLKCNGSFWACWKAGFVTVCEPCGSLARLWWWTTCRRGRHKMLWDKPKPLSRHSLVFLGYFQLWMLLFLSKMGWREVSCWSNAGGTEMEHIFILKLQGGNRCPDIIWSPSGTRQFFTEGTMRKYFEYEPFNTV